MSNSNLLTYFLKGLIGGLGPSKGVFKGLGRFFLEISSVVFLNCWPLGSGIRYPKIGFYVKFLPWNRLERSRIWNPGPKIGLGLFNNVFKGLKRIKVVIVLEFVVDVS